MKPTSERWLPLVEEYLRIRSRDAETMALKSWVLASLSMSQEARAAAEVAFALDPDHGESALWLAQAYALVGDDDPAREAIRRARAAGVGAERIASLPWLRRLGPAN